MDFLDPAKQRAHRTRLYIGYVLMTLAISFIALLLVFQAYGYDLNLRTGDITQKSLLFIDAHPETAEVFLNGTPKGATDKRLFVPADNYSLELRRDGYRTWRRDFTVMGGQIRRFVYPFMFPETITSTQMQLYAQEPDFVSQSPDRRWLVVREPNTAFGFSLVDLNSELASAAMLDLPTDLFNVSGPTHQFELVEWSTNNRHVVLRHIFEGGAEFVLIDREVPRASANLTKIFSSQPFTGLSLLNKQFDRYYLHNASNGLLSSAILQSGVVTPLIENVIQFKPHGDDVILYVTAANVPKGQAEVRLRQGNDIFTLRSLPSGPSYLLDVARFNGKWYVVAGVASEGKVYVLRDPQVALKRTPAQPLIPAATLRIENPAFISFSTNARFVAVQSGSQFSVYDAELATTHRFDMKLSLPPGRQASWMDGHRLNVVADGKVYVVDFDGTNQQELVPSYNNLKALFNSDFTALYTLAPAQIEGRAALFRSSLRVAP